MKGSKVVEKLSDSLIDTIIYSHSSDIDTLAHVLDIDSNYLSSQVRLHIPWYSREDISALDGGDVIRKILSNLKTELSEYGVKYKVHRLLNGIDSIGCGAQLKKGSGMLWIEDLNNHKYNLKFDTVPDTIGLEIQNSMHYIHRAREDTKYHLGLTLEDCVAPLCYASFSDNDREYLNHALRVTLPEKCSEPKRICVMTRAFGYNPLPKNMMSSLFSSCAKLLADEGYDYIITALNPFLGFKGSIFFGSSYFPFATSPMTYIYDNFGNYINRRSSAPNKITEQRYPTPPILWLVHPLRNRDLRRMEKIEIPNIYHISREEYNNG